MWVPGIELGSSGRGQVLLITEPTLLPPPPANGRGSQIWGREYTYVVENLPNPRTLVYDLRDVKIGVWTES